MKSEYEKEIRKLKRKKEKRLKNNSKEDSFP